MEMPNRKSNSQDYRYGYNGMEKDDETYAESGAALDFGARIYSSRLGRWLSVDPQAARGPAYSPYVYSFDNPIAFSDPDGEWAIWIHYRQTKRALKKAGIDKATAKEIAYYASTYADNPDKTVRALAKTVGVLGGINPKNFNEVTDPKRKNSQKDNTVDVAGHAMRAYHETDDDVSREEAVDRALHGGTFVDDEGNEHEIEGAWNVIERYKGADFENLTTNEKKEIGLALHTIQDAEAHHGGRWVDENQEAADELGNKREHSLSNDAAGDQQKSKEQTQKAANILAGGGS